MSDPNCDIRTNSNQTVADTTSDTKHANEEQGILIFFVAKKRTCYLIY